MKELEEKIECLVQAEAKLNEEINARDKIIKEKDKRIDELEEDITDLNQTVRTNSKTIQNLKTKSDCPQ